MRSNFQTVDEYIITFPAKVRDRLEQMRQVIKKAAPQAQEAISYQIPTFRLNGNLVHFAAYKNHIGFYPGSKAIEDFSGELSSYELSKGTVKFPLNKALPLDLIQKIVAYRVKANLDKSKGMKKRRHD